MTIRLSKDIVVDCKTECRTERRRMNKRDAFRVFGSRVGAAIHYFPKMEIGWVPLEWGVGAAI